MKVFVDTNVLRYAYDRAADSKHSQSTRAYERPRNAGRRTLSTQVLQQLHVNVRRKARPPIPPEDARALVADYRLLP